MTDEEMKRLEGLAKERDLYNFAFEATPEAVLALIERVRKAEAKVTELAAFAENFATTVEAASAHAENDGTGMQVPFHGDFAGAKRLPSLLQSLRWWARAAREAMGERRMYSDMLKDAERKGAEEMRGAAADWIRACSARATFTLRTPDGRPLNAEEQRMHGEVESGLKAILMVLADDIARKPLPGDAP